jgi:Fe-S cluster assembly iron-binding protein IscA
MLIVTDKAAQYLREALSRKGEGLPDAIRIVYTEENYRLILDDAKDGDQVFEQDGQNYLFVDALVGEALSDATLDVRESPHGRRITLAATGTPQAETQSEIEPVAESESKPESDTEPKPEP